MPMKIFVLTGSPRLQGNSNTLATHFIRGAEEAGHTVYRFDMARKNVHPCVGCDTCVTKGKCVFDDDFAEIRDNIVDADVVVLSTPMYYFGISAQLKTAIDRFYSINDQIHQPRKAVLLLTYADKTNREKEGSITGYYEILLKYLGWQDAGRVLAPGLWPAGAVEGTDYTRQAYELGKNL